MEIIERKVMSRAGVKMSTKEFIDILIENDIDFSFCIGEVECTVSLSMDDITVSKNGIVTIMAEDNNLDDFFVGIQ